VQDDLRAAGAGVDISGAVGDDLFAAGGGSGFVLPVRIADRTIDQGVHLSNSARIGGDAYIGGGETDIAGTINGTLHSGAGDINLGAQVGRDAQLYSNNIRVNDTARVNGILQYTSTEPVNVPEGVAANVQHAEPAPAEPPPSPATVFLGWLWRTVLILLGFALVGWLILRFAPKLLTQPAEALATRPVQAGLYGLLAAILFIVIPLATILLIVLMILFWGWLPGIVLGLFLIGALALIWFLSPLVTGLWLGQQLNLALGRGPDYLPILIGGILILALLGRVPILGWLVYLVSFIFALGGLLLARRSGGGGSLRSVTESSPVTPSPTPAHPSRA
jgi:hypothetical protein